MAYFLISVSNRKNLDLCIKHALAGFTDSKNGLWTFSEIQEGDYISFLYGARVFNLYEVKKKKAIKNADKIGPWPPVTFKMSGKTYYFPFRLYLNPIRELNEPMVRPEFAYVAENLLLRGGYRKTHFQADQLTLHQVSQMGELYAKPVDVLDFTSYEVFSPKVTFNRILAKTPETFPFQELILQSLVRQHLAKAENLQDFFNRINLGTSQAADFEVLGEKALPEGHIDMLIKHCKPIGTSPKIIIELKVGNINAKDVRQLKSYMDEIGGECVAAILIGKHSSKGILQEAVIRNIAVCFYSFEDIYKDSETSFEDLLSKLNISAASGGLT